MRMLMSVLAVVLMSAAPMQAMAAEPIAPTIQAVEPTSADEINAYLLQGLTRDRLSEAYPNLSEAELDKLFQRTELFVSTRTKR